MMGRQMNRLIGYLLAGAALATPAWPGEFRRVEPEVAPVLVVKDVNGLEHNLAAATGRVVLVNFWATWCPPCRQEMPSLQRLAHRMEGKPFILLAIDSGEPNADVQAFLRTMPARFPVLLDPDSVVTMRWKVFAMPTTFLIDKRGRVRYVFSGGTEWDSGEALEHIQKLLSE
jgi:thiol-disulfide isomerase/thioredoxin